MEVGTEISQKIRSAIKAKLVELGAYVDDELPDYIMVMVANKRSRAQMRKDLGLFLGTNTVSFTEWLHRLLAKLQTIRSDLDKSAEKQVKGGKLKAVGDKQKGEKQIISDLTSPTKSKQENVHSAEACSEKIQTDSDNGEGNKFKDTSDSRETGSSSNKQSLKSECDDSVRQDILTDTSPRDAVSSEEAVDAEVLNARCLSIESKTSSASHSPGHGQSYSVSRKRKIQSELTDVGTESEAFHPNSAFDDTASELTTDKSPSLQVTREILLQAVAEVEHSIAVKRGVSVMKPACHDNSYIEEYTPERKRSHDSLHEESPPPYIPSNKSVVDQRSCISKSKGTRQLRHYSKNTEGHEDCRELISRYRREELLRSIGIVRSSSQEVESFKPLTRDKSCLKGFEKFSCKRAVSGDSRSESIQNFQITAHLASSAFQHLDSVSHHNQIENHPISEPGLSCVSAGSASSMDTGTSISSRLVVERPGSFDVEGVVDVGNSRAGDILASSELRDTFNDATTQGKVNFIERLGTKSQNVSRIYPEQHEKDVISEQALQICRKKRRHSKYVSTVDFSDARSQCKYMEDTAGSPEGEGVALEQWHSQEAPAGVVESSNIGSCDDPAEPSGDEHQEPLQLLVKDVADDCMLDSAASDTAGWFVGGDGEKHGAVGPRKGTTFIVTLDGVDESQFGSRNVDEVQSGCEIAQPIQSAFEKVHAGLLENSGTMFAESDLGQFEDSGSMSEKVRCPAVLASVSVTPVVPSDLKQVWQEQKLLLCLEAARSEHLMLQKVQSLKLAAVDPELLPLKSHQTFLGVKDFDCVTDEVALEDCGSAEDIADEGEGSSNHLQPKLERCKFWPACAAGGSCGYYHPTTHCKMFPKCRFGDKCLFIHPNCRFDSRCTRPDCPYTHNGRRRSACISSASFVKSQQHFVLAPQPYKPHLLQPTFSSSQPTCRYFPNCKNRNCQFAHPKLCRFGLTCTNLSCPFFHPYMPNKKMLKWQNHCGKVKELSLKASSSIRTTASMGPGSTKTSRPTTVSSTSQ